MESLDRSSRPEAADEPLGGSARPQRVPSLRGRMRCVREFGRRRRTPITVAGSLGAAALLALALSGRRDEFATALSSASPWVLTVTVVVQIIALLVRSEAWHLTIQAAGGNVDRRILYRASSMQVLGSVLNGHLGVAARIAALRRSSPELSPQVPTPSRPPLPSWRPSRSSRRSDSPGGFRPSAFP
jgi:hypothetical protein